MDLTATKCDQIGQSPDEKITFDSEPLQLPFVRYSLIAQDLQNQANLLKNVPS